MSVHETEFLMGIFKKIKGVPIAIGKRMISGNGTTIYK